jgi:oxazoline/thiazoline dehydrogenase
MRPDLLLALKRRVGVRRDGADLVLAGDDRRDLRLRSPHPAVAALVENLVGGGKTADELCETTFRDHTGADYARLFFILEALDARGLLRHTLASRGRNLATLEPISTSFRFADLSLDGRFRLSRFACLRRSGSEALLECPLGAAAVWLHDRRTSAAIASLAEPRTVSDVAAELDVGDGDGAAFVSLLANAQAVFSCDANGRIAEDDNVALRQWEFHDLLFHTRSRLGRHEYPYGGTFRLAGEFPPLPAVKPPMSERRVALYKPDMAALDEGDPSFSHVLETRRSVRTGGVIPMSAAQLGEFLYRVARITVVQRATPGDAQSYEASLRPCAAGGAMHEIELYLTISRCAGMDPGLYHYAPLAHELEHLANLGPRQKRLLADACAFTGLDASPDVLLTFAARLPRVAWKYESMAYALILKDAGVLYHQMYLVATAMNLAPCALGGGNSDAFGQAAGLDYYAETSVAEFILSSR